MQFGAFAESMLDALIVASDDGLIAYGNHVAERMFGYDPGGLIGQNIIVLMPERYQTPHTDGMRRLSAGEPARIIGHSVELEALRRDGREFPIELSLSSWRSETGAIFFGAIIRDITQRRAAELRERTVYEVSRAIAESETFLDGVTRVAETELGTLVARSTSLEAVTSIVEQMEVGVMVYRLEKPPDDRTLRTIALNPAACSILGMKAESAIGRTLDENFPQLRELGIPQTYRDVVVNQEPIEIENVFYTDDRVAAAVFAVKAFPLPHDCVGVAFEDITERRTSQLLLLAERQLLEDVAGRIDVNAALRRIAEFVEQQCPDVKASVFRMDEAGTTLRHVTSPSMPPEFARLVQTIPVGPDEGSCGTAAYRRERVVVADALTDPLFEKYRDLALSYGLRASWSMPILDREGGVLGTLAMYLRRPGAPGAHHLKVFEFATRIAATAIEKSVADDDLRAGEERLQALLQHSADAVLLLDAEGIIRYRSPAAKDLLGYRDVDVVGKSVFSIIHPDQREWAATRFRGATAGKEVVIEELRAVREDGAERWVEVTISNQLDHPILKSMIVNYRDVTDRIEALDSLWQKEEQYRAIVDAVTDSILIIDSTLHIVTANNAALEMYGYTLDELAGRPATDLVHAMDYPKVEAFAARAGAGEPYYAESVHLRKDGSEVHVVVRGTGFLIGGVRHLLAVISNVSEQKRMQQRLERADRIGSLGRLAATIAHEMNNVMMGIMPFSEIIQRRSQHDAVLQNAAAHIAESVERGKVVTEEILRFTRATGVTEFKPLDGSRLLNNVANELRPRLHARTTLTVFCEESLHLLGDAAQLQQVVTNLVLNAQDAMPRGGKVKVTLASCSPEAFARFGGGGDGVDAYAHLCVSDSGDGIPPHVMPHIFEPLFTTKGSSGTGLGLAVVHQIVMAHDGQIDVDSGLGRGTTFHILLKKTAPETKRVERVEDIDNVWLRIRTAVLVEDDPSVGEGISAMLQMEGVECEWIECGAAAVEKLKSFRPDLLILDVGLPDMSGMEVYRLVAQMYPDLPTIFSTGHGDHRMLSELDPKAPVGFLSKPYGLETLARSVQSLLAGRTEG